MRSPGCCGTTRSERGCERPGSRPLCATRGPRWRAGRKSSTGSRSPVPADLVMLGQDPRLGGGALSEMEAFWQGAAALGRTPRLYYLGYRGVRQRTMPAIPARDRGARGRSRRRRRGESDRCRNPRRASNPRRAVAVGGLDRRVARIRSRSQPSPVRLLGQHDDHGGIARPHSGPDAAQTRRAPDERAGARSAGAPRASCAPPSSAPRRRPAGGRSSTRPRSTSGASVCSRSPSTSTRSGRSTTANGRENLQRPLLLFVGRASDPAQERRRSGRRVQLRSGARSRRRGCGSSESRRGSRSATTSRSSATWRRWPTSSVKRACSCSRRCRKASESSPPRRSRPACRW